MITTSMHHVRGVIIAPTREIECSERTITTREITIEFENGSHVTITLYSGTTDMKLEIE